MKRVLQSHLSVVIAAIVCCSGCSTIEDYKTDWHLDRMAQRQAKKTWSHSKPHYECIEHDLDDFRRGFIDGYVSVVEGGDSCPPSVPPKHYWKARYSTPEGKKQVVAWYDGYGHGAAAAFADGLNGSRTLLTAAEIYGRSRQYVEYVPPADNPTTQHLIENDVLIPLPEQVQPELLESELDNLKLKEVPQGSPYVPELKPADKN